MKIKVHVPTEQYGFVEAEFAADQALMGADAASSIYEKLKAEFNRPINELPPKEFDKLIENQLKGDTNHTDLVERMSPAQRLHYNTNKRAINRINSQLQKDKEN